MSLMDLIDRRGRSLVAFQTVMESGLIPLRCAQVYAIHYRATKPLTKRAMYEIYLRDHPNSIVQVDSFGPRYAQLVDGGLFEETGASVCPYTGMTVTEWDVTTKTPTERLRSRPQGPSRKQLIAEVKRLTKLVESLGGKP